MPSGSSVPGFFSASPRGISWMGVVAAMLVLPAFPVLAQSLRLQVLDVGQGDAILIQAPDGCAALIDGGPTGAGAAIQGALGALGITRLEFAVVSHYHADHIGGLDEVDAGPGAVEIPVVYDRGGSYSSATYTQYASHFGRRFLFGMTI